MLLRAPLSSGIMSLVYNAKAMLPLAEQSAVVCDCSGCKQCADHFVPRCRRQCCFPVFGHQLLSSLSLPSATKQDLVDLAHIHCLQVTLHLGIVCLSTAPSGLWYEEQYEGKYNGQSQALSRSLW